MYASASLLSSSRSSSCKRCAVTSSASFAASLALDPAEDKGTPKTLGEFYDTGVSATGNLADKYSELATRDDNGVFRDFLNATYPYLKDGPTASEIFSSQ